MTSILNNSTACGEKGAFGVGTGDTTEYSKNFMNTVIVPKNPATGAVLPGYSLQSSTTSATGLAWNFTGANGKTIATYQYPNNCPVPFPTPDEIPSDLVLITREDAVTAESGLVDLYMPVIGSQGNVPRHSIPPVCDVTNQLVFFFDDANAAINVYNRKTRTWAMGWVRALGSFDFAWRAADVLAGDKVNAAYAAPYNVQGIFFSCASASFTNSIFERVTLTTSIPGFYFLNYTTDFLTGDIQPWNTANFTLPTLNQWPIDLFVSAICVVNCNDTSFATPATPITVIQIVCAVAVDENSDLCRDRTVPNSPLYAWWGFLGTQVAGTVPRLLNPNLSIVFPLPAGGVPTAYLYSIRSPAPANLATGSIQTISYDPGNRIFFLGGNFSNLRFNDVIIKRTFLTGFEQIGAVALQYRYVVSAAMTINNYDFVGLNGNTIASQRDWTGIITQSNFNDGFFGYGGNFQTPPSNIGQTSTAGFDPVTTPFVAVVPSQTQSILPIPYAQALIPPEAKGGRLRTLDLLFPDTGFPFPSDGSITTINNVAIGLVPDDGDLRQSSFPPEIVGGNFLQPVAFQTNFFFKAQSTSPIIAADWWLSSIELFVQNAPATQVIVRAYMYPDNVFSRLAAPIQFFNTITLINGRNYLTVFGGGTALTTPLGNSGGLYLNSNLIIGGGDLTTFIVPRTWFLELEFSDAATDNPLNVSLGINTGGQSLYPLCWNLRGYSTSGISVTSPGPGLFSSRALANGSAIQAAAGGRRVLTYNNLVTDVPLNIINYNVFIVPINWLKTNAGYALRSTPPIQTQSGAVALLTFREDVQGDFAFSCMNLSLNPSVMYEIPGMTSSDAIAPAISLYLNSRKEIYKVAWANSDRVALGLYTNFQELSNLQFVLQTPASIITGALNRGKAKFDVTFTQLQLNTFNGFDAPPNYAGLVDFGDVLVFSTAGLPGVVTLYRVTGIVTQTGSPNFIATIPVALVSAIDFSPALPANILLDILISRNPTQTPFVLKENFGPYLIGNGSAPTTARDVYLASYEPTSKCYRYVPDYQSSFLSFKSSLFVGAPTVDDTVLANTVLFNTNNAAILLSKASSAVGGSLYWNVTSVSGNIGFNNQS